jgi:hypothetical protein
VVWAPGEEQEQDLDSIGDVPIISRLPWEDLPDVRVTSLLSILSSFLRKRRCPSPTFDYIQVDPESLGYQSVKHSLIPLIETLLVDLAVDVRLVS